MTKPCKKVRMKWTSHLAQGWTRIAGAQHHNLHENIIALLKAGKSYNSIVSLLGCSKSTISKIAKCNPKP